MQDWDAEVRELGPRLLKYFRASFPPSLASELVQETLIRLVRKEREGRFDPRLGSLAQLAFGMAHYVRLEALKAGPPPFIETELEATGPAPDESLDAERARSRLRRALRGLKEVERQIVLLHIDEEMRLGEIAAILGLPLGTVKSHLHRAKQSLRQALCGGNPNAE